MRKFFVLAALLALFMGVASPLLALAQGQATVTIAVDLDPNSATGLRTEGLVSDSAGRLYTSDTASRTFYRFTPSSGSLETLGTLPRSATGMAFDAAGNLYMASGDVILRVGSSALQGNQISATDVVTFAMGVTGANGLAFDASGRLFASGGATGNIYLVASDGVTSTFASGLTSEREEQRISTNGLAFWTDGMLYSSNTGTGSITRITVSADGTAGQVEQWVKDPLLIGADGITFAANGDLYVAANERNAIVRVSPQGQVTEVAVNGNSGPLEFPASPAFSGNALYASNFDIERGANAPAAPGIGASIARIDVGVGGLPLPVTSAPPSQATPPAGTPVAGTPVAGTAVPATPEATPTTAVATAVPISAPEPTATVEAPGMPRTGGEQWPILFGLLALCGLALATGLAFRRKEQAER